MCECKICILLSQHALPDLAGASFANSTELVPIGLDRHAPLLHFQAAIGLHNAKNWTVTACSRVIGVVGHIDHETAQIAHSLAHRSGLKVTLVAVPPTATHSPFVLNLNPTEHYIRALVGLCEQMSWTRVALISDGLPHHHIASELLQMSKLQWSVVTSHPHKHEMALQAIKAREINIIIVLLSTRARCSLLQMAEAMHLVWPQYAWIVLDTELAGNSTCLFDGVLLIESSIPLKRKSVLHDSVKAAVLGIGDNGSFMGASGLVVFRDNKRLINVSIIQLRKGRRFEVARYNGESQRLSVVSLNRTAAPKGSLRVVYNESTWLHKVLVVMSSFLSFAFVTIMLVLFIVFRREKEVKATSVSVSLAMFLGCYLMLLFVPLLLIKSHPQHKVMVPHAVTCNVLVWLGGTGLPLPLIFATIFVKMLRVYAIFQRPFSVKRKLLTDGFLFLYIVLLVSPIFIFLCLWSAIDPLVNHQITQEFKGHRVILEYCLSVHTAVWLVIPIAYLSFFMVAVVIIALITSSLKFKHFRDAKATNAFVFVAIVTTIMGTFYWLFFSLLPPTSENYRSAETTLNICLTLIPISCQVFLFLPKVYAPTRRWFYGDKVKKKLHHCKPS